MACSAREGGAAERALFLSWCGEVIPPEPWQSVSGKATDLFFRQAAALFPPFQMKICHTFIIDVDSTICFVW